MLLAHEVGAGKTAEMVIGAMELRRLGMAQARGRRAQPHARAVLPRVAAALPAGPRPGRRRSTTWPATGAGMLVARVATGDWDAVILSRSAFERLPLSPRRSSATSTPKLADDAPRSSKRQGQASGLTVKRMEGTLARAEERLKKLTDGAKDPGISFEQTGIDYLVRRRGPRLQEPAHRRPTSPASAIDGSQRASDLDMKLRLPARAARRPGRHASPPPPRSPTAIAEAYIMQRYLRPDLLEHAGMTDFDTWAATFGEVVTDLELSPDGSRYRMQSRFAKFRNVPELLRMWHVVADIKTAEDLNLPTPGPARRPGAETVVVPPSDRAANRSWPRWSERAEQVRAKAVPARGRQHAPGRHPRPDGRPRPAAARPGERPARTGRT